MKYVAFIDTDDIKNLKFYEDANGKYLVARDTNAEPDEWIALHFTEAENNGTVSLEKLDEVAKETARHLIECYEDNCFTKDERTTLAGLVLKARLRYQLNKHKETEDD